MPKNLEYMTKKCQIIAKALLESSNEISNLTKLLEVVNRNCRILDVGCGFGDKIRLLNDLGFFDVVGVEKNPYIVKVARSRGLNVIHVDKLKQTFSNRKFDLIVFSHVIEHFSYGDLLPFLESYLELSIDGGFVLFASPLMSNFFFDDFDHVKPYHPAGLEHVFGGLVREVQFHSKFRLVRKDIYFRRMPFNFFRYTRGSYLGRRNYFIIVINVFSALAFRITSGLIGQVTGWAGLYTVHHTNTRNITYGT